MSDRELLKAAAKAAGIALEGVESDGRGVRIDGTYWQPLHDDGDALRLYARLPWMCIETSDVGVTVRQRENPDEPPRVYLMWTEWLDRHAGNVCAATRRAIVRAAAAIGGLT